MPREFRRALAYLLLYGEPTAALDPASEQQVRIGYRRAMRGRTTILITDHFSLAAEADRVVVIGDRGIVEQGQPAELLAGGGPICGPVQPPAAGKVVSR